MFSSELSLCLSVGNGYFAFPGALAFKKMPFLNFSFFWPAFRYHVFIVICLASNWCCCSLSLAAFTICPYCPGKVLRLSGRPKLLDLVGPAGGRTLSTDDDKALSLLESSTGTLPAAAKIYTSYPCLECFCFYCCLSARAPRTPHGKYGKGSLLWAKVVMLLYLNILLLFFLFIKNWTPWLICAWRWN